jgi:chromosomal replication initiator protein
MDFCLAPDFVQHANSQAKRLYPLAERLLAVPENRVACAAVAQVLEGLATGHGAFPATNPLVAYGPAGSGKSLLVSKFSADATRMLPQIVISSVPASEWTSAAHPGTDESGQFLDTVRQTDVLVVEDLQYLSRRAVCLFSLLLDECLERSCQVLITANAGPARLDLPARILSRLAGGLVVRLEPLQAPSRLQILLDLAQRRQLAVTREVLHWLAEHLKGGGRELEGAISRLVTLAKLRLRPLDVATVAHHFRPDLEHRQLTMDRILREVGEYFKVPVRQLQSSGRTQNVLWPRQVAMYLARRFTKLSLSEIGDHCGGRDHSTVLHACRKVEKAVLGDNVLAGALRQMEAGWL